MFQSLTNMAMTTTPALFLTRWITHFCAPVFLFTAGTSAIPVVREDLDARVLNCRDFLLTRGLWLIVLELFS